MSAMVIFLCPKSVPSVEVAGFIYGWVVAEDRCINVPTAVMLVAAVVEFPDDALKKLQRAERMRAKFRKQRRRKPPS